jgi:excisionase family DNA binding protein
VIDAEAAIERLEFVAARLRERGAPDLADEVRQVIGQLSDGDVAAAAGEPDLLTTGEAAALLGVRSINTIKKWAIDGLLDGYRRGRRIKVTRASVERMRSHPTVAAERARTADEEAAWAPFDAGDSAPLPVLAAPGRKPWES